MKPTGLKTISSNKKVRFDYTVLDTVECGIVLHGSEVKSLRDAKVQISDAFARFERGEAWLYGMHINPYSHSFGYGVVDPDRRRKLLLHKDEIERLDAWVSQSRLSMVPLQLYFKDGRAKIEIAIAKGRDKGDKRNAMAEADAKREMQVAMGRANKGRDH
jgi:SsrA-binding protein